MKERNYIVRLNQVYGLGIQGTSDRPTAVKSRILTGIFITNTRCMTVVDSHGHFFTYQKMAPESFFDVFFEGQWHDRYSVETEKIMDRHWEEDNL